MLYSLQSSHTDLIWMNRALDLAQLGRLSTRPNPAVGCVIVKGGQVVGEAWHQQAGQPHAEVLALRQAAEHAKYATAYVTLEPCSHFGKTPPCCNALIAAGVKRVVIAMTDPNPLVSGRGIAALAVAGIEVTQNVARARAKALNAGFVMRMQTGRPLVSLKLATSLDAKVALANGESQWITNELARHQGHLLRAQHCAILTGIDSVIVDDPQLTVRVSDNDLNKQGWSSQRRVEPFKVVLDSHLRLPLTAKLCEQPDTLIVYTTQTALTKQASKYAQLLDLGVKVHVVAQTNHSRVELVEVLNHLAAHYQCNNVMIEAGGTLAGAMLNQQLVDEVHWFSAPIVLGPDAQSALNLLSLQYLEQATYFELQEQQLLGDNFYRRYQCVKA